MQDANAELVRRFYGALNANDLAGLRSLCQNIEFVNPESAAEPGTRVGPDAFRAAFEGLHANFEAFRCEPERITPFRHSLVGVVARSTGSGRMSAIPFEEVHGHVLKLIRRFEWFQNVDAAYAAAAERSFRAGMESYSRGDYDEALTGFHPDIEWWVADNVMPDAGLFQGHEGVRRFWTNWSEVMEDMSLDIELCTAIDRDRVLAVTRASGKGAGSGIAVASGRFAQVAEFEDGLAVRVRLSADVRATRASVGLD
jgi:ketosteroid isomerase-like protein